MQTYILILCTYSLPLFFYSLLFYLSRIKTSFKQTLTLVCAQRLYHSNYMHITGYQLTAHTWKGKRTMWECTRESVWMKRERGELWRVWRYKSSLICVDKERESKWWRKIQEKKEKDWEWMNEIPIFSAVSCLSPVIIHTLMPRCDIKCGRVCVDGWVCVCAEGYVGV